MSPDSGQRVTAPAGQTAQSGGGNLGDGEQAACPDSSRGSAQALEGCGISSREASEPDERLDGSLAQKRDDFISRLATERLRGLLGEAALPGHASRPPEEVGSNTAALPVPQTEGEVSVTAERNKLLSDFAKRQSAVLRVRICKWSS